MFQKKEIALLASLAYVNAGYRIVNVYVRMAVGEYSAMLFLPIAALAVYRIYTDSGASRKRCRSNALLLAAGMTGLIGTHVLTTEMTCFFLLLVCILLWKKTLQKQVLKTYLYAVLETVILNLYFIVPFVDYYFHVDVNIRHSMDEGAMMIQKNGAQIGEYFAFFQNIFGSHMGLTPGLVLMTALIAAAVLVINRQASGQIRFYTGLSVCLLFLASRNFPWDYLSAHAAAGRMLAQIQFPWRFLSLAVVVLSMLLGSMFQQLYHVGQPQMYKKLLLLTAGACAAMSVFYASDYVDAGGMIHYYDTAEVNTYATGSLYIRTGSNQQILTGAITGDNHMAEISSVSRSGSHMELFCRAKEDADGSVEVPFFHYKGYRVRDEQGREYEISDGYNNVVRFTVPAGYAGKFTVDFVQPWYWKAGAWVSLGYAVCLVIRGMAARRKKRGV